MKKSRPSHCLQPILGVLVALALFFQPACSAHHDNDAGDPVEAAIKEGCSHLSAAAQQPVQLSDAVTTAVDIAYVVPLKVGTWTLGLTSAEPSMGLVVETVGHGAHEDGH